jgi:hypothetical protein
MQFSREDQETTYAPDGWNARYPSPKLLLGIKDDDLAPIWLDDALRKELGCEPIGPLLVRRDASSAIAREIRDFGIAALLSFLGLQAILNPVLSLLGWSETTGSAIAVGVAVVLAAILIVWRLRTDIR